MLTGPTGPKGNKRRIVETRLGKYKKGADGQPKYDPNKQVNKINGVDVSNLKATLSPQNWKKLGKEGQTYVIERRKLLNLSDGNKQGPKKQISRQEQRIAQLEQKLLEVTKRTQATAEHVDELTDDLNDKAKGASNGTLFGRGRRVSVLKTAPTVRRIPISKLSEIKRIESITTWDAGQGEAGIEGNNELDSHADSCAVGSNFRALSTNGEVVSVHPFSDNYHSIPNVSIVEAGTVWTNPKTGKEYLIVLNEALWMGDVMSHSLINPNQIRHSGNALCDDPYYQHRKLGITLAEDFIPFVADGTILLFRTRSPTDEEIEVLPRIALTNKSWDPKNVVLVEQVKQLDDKKKEAAELA